MIYGQGIDIVSVERLKEVYKKYGKVFLEKIFHQNELDRLEKIGHNHAKVRYLAKRFAAKEAFAKACKKGIGSKIKFSEIEVINEPSGAPKILLHGATKDFIDEKFSIDKINIHLSLADEENTAIASVIIEIM